MALHGKRDPDGEKRRIEKAQEAGFGQPGVAGRPRKDATEIIENKAAERMEYLADKAIDAIERGLKSPNEKTALSASAQYFKTFYHPTKKVDINSKVERKEEHIHVLKAQNELSEGDQKLLGDLLDVLRDAKDEPEVIEAEVVEEEPRELEEGDQG